MAALANKFYSERRFEIVEEYYELTKETEKHRFKELEAAIRIQAYFRMYIKRTLYKEMKSSVRKIKRAWKCHQTRKQYWKKIDEELMLRRREFYSAAVINIQRVYRGYYFRKYTHDFYARMHYLDHLRSKNQEMRESMNKYYDALKAEQARQQEDYARLEFNKLASSLHHLTSTKAIPGVYRHLEQVSDFGKSSINLP